MGTRRQHGIAAPSPAPTPTALRYLSARLELVRVLTLVLSLDSLRSSPPELERSSSSASSCKWRDAFLRGIATEPEPTENKNDNDDGDDDDKMMLPRRAVLCLLCSLLNTALSPDAPGSVGTSTAGPTTPAGTLWRARALVERATAPRGADAPHQVHRWLRAASLELVDVLLIRHSITGDSNNDERAADGGDDDGDARNLFAHYATKLHRAFDLAFIAEGVASALASALESTTTHHADGAGVLSLGSAILGAAAPGSAQQQARERVERATFARDALVLLMRFLEHPRAQLARVINERSGAKLAPRLYVLLLALALAHKDDVQQLALVRLCCFALQTLTADRDFGAQVCTCAIDAAVPVSGSSSSAAARQVVDMVRPPDCVTVADWGLCAVHALIFTTRAKLASLYPTLLLGVSNVSHAFTDVSRRAAGKLVHLVTALSSPSFVLMEEGNPRLVYYVLEALNNVVHVRFHQNPHVVLALVRGRDTFHALASFQLSTAVSEARRLRRARKPSSSPGASHDDLATATASASDESEKARGKRREDDDDEEQAFVGKHGFVPTESWIASWREGLPLDGILVLLSELHITAADGDDDDDEENVEYVRTLDVSKLLPPSASAGTPRRRPFVPTRQSAAWLASVVYGGVYVRQLELLREMPVRLFAVEQVAAPGGASLLGRFR